MPRTSQACVVPAEKNYFWWKESRRRRRHHPQHQGGANWDASAAAAGAVALAAALLAARLAPSAGPSEEGTAGHWSQLLLEDKPREETVRVGVPLDDSVVGVLPLTGDHVVRTPSGTRVVGSLDPEPVCLVGRNGGTTRLFRGINRRVDYLGTVCRKQKVVTARVEPSGDGSQVTIVTEVTTTTTTTSATKPMLRLDKSSDAGTLHL
eukprot:gene6755-10355_t